MGIERGGVGNPTATGVWAGHERVVAVVTDQLASRWVVSTRVRQTLVLGVAGGAIGTLRQPVALLVAGACGCILVRTTARREVVTDLLMPYVAALVDAFGPVCAEALSVGAAAPRRGDTPIAWVLATWRADIEARVGAPTCRFGAHDLGCTHRPFRVDASAGRPSPAAFGEWVGALRASGLVA